MLISKQHNTLKNKRILAFVHAFRGLRLAFWEEVHMRFHAVAVLGVLLLGIIYPLTPIEWMIAGVLIALVIGLEIINSAIEKLCDAVHPEKHPMIKDVKDLSAAAVLWASLLAAGIGVWIFIPKIWN